MRQCILAYVQCLKCTHYYWRILPLAPGSKNKLDETVGVPWCEKCGGPPHMEAYWTNEAQAKCQKGWRKKK